MESDDEVLVVREDGEWTQLGFWVILRLAYIVTNWVRHSAKSRSRDLPRDLSRDFMTPYAIT
jgi:hypothetical protein